SISILHSTLPDYSIDIFIDTTLGTQGEDAKMEYASIQVYPISLGNRKQKKCVFLLQLEMLWIMHLPFISKYPFEVCGRNGRKLSVRECLTHGEFKMKPSNEDLIAGFVCALLLQTYTAFLKQGHIDHGIFFVSGNWLARVPV
ncbi:hypothetical protein ACJX0J_020551, partial [Zea mays]